MGQTDSAVENYKLSENNRKSSTTRNEVSLRKFPTNYDFKSDEPASKNSSSGKTKNGHNNNNNNIRQTFSSPAISNYKKDSANGSAPHDNPKSKPAPRKNSTDTPSTSNAKPIVKDHSTNSLAQQTSTKVKNRTSSKYKKKFNKSSSINGVELIVRKKLITTTTTTTLNPAENGLISPQECPNIETSCPNLDNTSCNNNSPPAINIDNTVDTGYETRIINQQQANPSSYADAVASLIPDSLFTSDHSVIISASSNAASKINLIGEDGEELNNHTVNVLASQQKVSFEQNGGNDLPNSPTSLASANLTSTIKKEQLEYEFRIKRIPRNHSSKRFLSRSSKNKSSSNSGNQKSTDNKSYKTDNEEDATSDLSYSSESFCFPLRIELNKSLVSANRNNYRCVLFGIGCCPKSIATVVVKNSDNGDVVGCGSGNDHEPFGIRHNKIVKSQPSALTKSKNQPTNETQYESVGLFSYIVSCFLSKCCCCFVGTCDNDKCTHTKINENDIEEIEKNSIYNRENYYEGANNEYEIEEMAGSGANCKHVYSSKLQKDGVYMTTTTTDDVYVNDNNNNLKSSTPELSHLGFTKRLANLFCCCCCCILNYFSVNSNNEEEGRSYFARKRCCNGFGERGDGNEANVSLNNVNNNSDDEYEIRNDDKKLNAKSASKSSKKKVNMKHSDSDILDPPPITCIRVLRPSNDLTPVRFDSHYNIIQALNNGNSVSEDGSDASTPQNENFENYEDFTVTYSN